MIKYLINTYEISPLVKRTKSLYSFGKTKWQFLKSAINTILVKSSH